MIDYKGHQFENNPNGMNTNVQWEGKVYLKYAGESTISVYGFTQQQVVETALKFKEIEPKAFIVEVYGPMNFLCTHRDYVTDIMI